MLDLYTIELAPSELEVVSHARDLRRCHGPNRAAVSGQIAFRFAPDWQLDPVPETTLEPAIIRLVANSDQAQPTLSEEFLYPS